MNTMSKTASDDSLMEVRIDMDKIKMFQGKIESQADLMHERVLDNKENVKNLLKEVIISSF